MSEGYLSVDAKFLACGVDVASALLFSRVVRPFAEYVCRGWCDVAVGWSGYHVYSTRTNGTADFVHDPG